MVVCGGRGLAGGYEDMSQQSLLHSSSSGTRSLAHEDTQDRQQQRYYSPHPSQYPDQYPEQYREQYRDQYPAPREQYPAPREQYPDLISVQLMAQDQVLYHNNNPHQLQQHQQQHYQQHPQHPQHPMVDWCQEPDSAAPQPEPEPVYTGGSAEVSGMDNSSQVTSRSIYSNKTQSLLS